MAGDPGVTLLVNSTDSFEDCWEPFFKLLSIYWKDCPYDIVLNTETKPFSYPGLSVRASQVGVFSDASLLTWSAALRRCLRSISTELVLYLQEDYFLRAPVRTELVRRFANLMSEHELRVIRLMECGNSGPWLPSKYPDLWQVARSSNYLVSLQASLWNKDLLEGLTRAHESPWQLEKWGTKRLRRSGVSVFCVDRHKYAGEGKEVIPYLPTGIQRGRWNAAAVCDLFPKHEINVDFSRRGFYSSPSVRPPRSYARRAGAILRSLPDRVRSSF